MSDSVVQGYILKLTAIKIVLEYDQQQRYGFLTADTKKALLMEVLKFATMEINT
jgi:hypothetical protein